MATRRVTTPTWRDGLLAVALGLADVLTQWQAPWLVQNSGAGAWVVLGYAAIGYTALVFRRVRPGPVFAVMWVHSVAGQVFLPSYRPFLGVLVAFWTFCALTSHRRSLLALAAMAVVSGLAIRSEVAEAPLADRGVTLFVDTLLFAVLMVAIWWVARRVGAGARRIDELEQRRASDARAAVALERSRIARDLHDIVAHSVTVMVLQAGGARRIAEPRGPTVEQALADIEAVGRQTMTELRRLLGVLTPVDGAGQDGVADARPPLGLGDLPAVVERIAKAGLSVGLEQHGDDRAVDSSVALAAHRVVTEALTNALKYAPPGAHATVRLEWGDTDLTVTVADDGGDGAEVDRPVPGAALSGGRGLVGLAERVRSVGGTFDAGPEPSGGFRVSAVLPVALPGTPVGTRAAAGGPA